MASGDVKLDSDGVRLLQDDGDQRLESDDNDCCCGCWKLALKCDCGPTRLGVFPIELRADEDPAPSDTLYVPCDLVTEDIVFIPPGPFVGTIGQNNCYFVGPGSDEVSVLPDGATEGSDLTNLFETCNDCCGTEELEACCFPDDTCLDLPRNGCVDQGGTPRGEGTACASTECNVPKQECPANCPSSFSAAGVIALTISDLPGWSAIVPAGYTASLVQVGPNAWRADLIGTGSISAEPINCTDDDGKQVIEDPVTLVVLTCFVNQITQEASWALTMQFRTFVVNPDDSCNTGAFYDASITLNSPIFIGDGCLPFFNSQIITCCAQCGGNGNGWQGLINQGATIDCSGTTIGIL